MKPFSLDLQIRFEAFFMPFSYIIKFVCLILTNLYFPFSFNQFNSVLISCYAAMLNYFNNSKNSNNSDSALWYLITRSIYKHPNMSEFTWLNIVNKNI